MKFLHRLTLSSSAAIAFLVASWLHSPKVINQNPALGWVFAFAPAPVMVAIGLWGRRRLKAAEELQSVFLLYGRSLSISEALEIPALSNLQVHEILQLGKAEGFDNSQVVFLLREKSHEVD